MIKALATVPEEKLTPAFVDAVDRLSGGMSSHDKMNLIRALTTVPTENLTLLMARFTPQHLTQLQQFVPHFQRSELIVRLSRMASHQWVTEINRVIHQYRHVAGGGVAFEIHNYANNPSSGLSH